MDINSPGAGAMALYRRWIGGGGELVARYTSSIADDWEIAEAVVKAMKSHVEHLTERGLIPSEDGQAILRALDEVKIEDLLSPKYEDVHEALEDYLIRRLGERGGWAGLGRSRNDHVAAAIRLQLLAHLSSLEASVDGLRCVLAKRALEYAGCVMPSFTHFQPAQPITFGHYLMAMEELLEDFKSLSPSIKSVVDKSPLGSGPAGGTAAPLDRPRLAQLAGFSSAAVNTLYASSSRFFASAAASLVAALLVELSRFVDDLVAWSSPMIGYLRSPDDHVSTSSIMPHKRNPVTLEVFRARISEAVADLVALLGIQEKIGYGYSLDLQEATRHLWRIFKIADEGLSILADFLANAAFDCGRAGTDAERYPVTSSDAAERMALGGTPFRAAYFKIAEAVKRGEFKPPPPGDAVRRPVLGSPHPDEVRRMAKRVLESCGSSPQA